MLPYALMLPELLPLPLPPHSQILVFCLAAPTSIMQSATETPWTLYNPLTSSFKPLHCFSDPLVSLVLGVSRHLSSRGPSPKQKLPTTFSLRSHSKSSCCSTKQASPIQETSHASHHEAVEKRKLVQCIPVSGHPEECRADWERQPRTCVGAHSPGSRDSESPLSPPRFTSFFGLQETTTNFPRLWTFKPSLVCTPSSIYVSNHQYVIVAGICTGCIHHHHHYPGPELVGQALKKLKIPWKAPSERLCWQVTQAVEIKGIIIWIRERPGHQFPLYIDVDEAERLSC